MFYSSFIIEVNAKLFSENEDHIFHQIHGLNSVCGTQFENP